MTAMRLEVLSEELTVARLAELIALDRTIEGDRWAEKEFRVELPGKFRHSRLALGPGGAPAAFVVASRKGDRVHVHRLAVGPLHQRTGLGRRLVAAVAASALEEGLAEMTLKVSDRNVAARRFYERLGFRVLETTREGSQLVASNAELVARLEAPERAGKG